jgi:hypothetical protein
VHVIVALKIDQTDGVVVVGETLGVVLFVLEDAAAEIFRHSDAESAAGAVLDHVDVEVIFRGAWAMVNVVLSSVLCRRSRTNVTIWREETNTRSLDLPSLSLGTSLGMTELVRGFALILPTAFFFLIRFSPQHLLLTCARRTTIEAC